MQSSLRSFIHYFQFIVEYLADNKKLINKQSLADFLILPRFETHARITGLIFSTFRISSKMCYFQNLDFFI